MSPAVSIVVPIYNVGEYVRRCLDSLIGQSLENIEIICVDDGSTDDGPDIVAQYAARDRRVIALRQPKQGVSAARNAALARASGRYLVSVDADDWLETAACAQSARLLDSDPELDYVAWGSRIVYSGDPPPSADQFEAQYQVKYEGRTAVTGEVRLNTVANVCNKMLRMEPIRRFNILFSNHPVGEDGGFWYKFAAHARFGHYLDEPFYNYYRGRGDSATGGRTVLPDLNWLTIFEDIHAHYARHGQLDEVERAFLARVFLNLYFADLHQARDRRVVRNKAAALATALDLSNLDGDIIKALKAGRDHEWGGYSLAEKIFSIKNRDRIRVITLLGLEIKFARKKRRQG